MTDNPQPVEAVRDTRVITVWPCEHGQVLVESGPVPPNHSCQVCGERPEQFVPEAALEERERELNRLRACVPDDDGLVRYFNDRSALERDLAAKGPCAFCGFPADETRTAIFSIGDGRVAHIACHYSRVVVALADRDRVVGEALVESIALALYNELRRTIALLVAATIIPVDIAPEKIGELCGEAGDSWRDEAREVLASYEQQRGKGG